MIVAGQDVLHAAREEGRNDRGRILARRRQGGGGRPSPAASGCDGGVHRDVELVVRLIDAALLSEDVDAAIVGHERVDEVHRLIVGRRMGEDDAVGGPRADPRGQDKRDIAHARAQRGRGCNHPGAQVELRLGAVDRQAYAVRGVLGIASFLDGGDTPFAVGIDPRQHGRCNRYAGREPDPQGEAVLGDGNRRRLQIFVQAVGRRRRNEREQLNRPDCQEPSHAHRCV